MNLGNNLKMREVYNPTSATHTHFENALHNDLGIYHVQRGAGIGGFFKSLLTKIVPIGKSILKGGFEIAKPHLQEMGKEIVSKGVKAVKTEAMKKINQPKQPRKTTQKPARKRNRVTPYKTRDSFEKHGY